MITYREMKRIRRDREDGFRREDYDMNFQPVMMTFKAFLQTQDDSITDQEALVKYGEYKLEFQRQQLNEFFVHHKDYEWFRNRYHPSVLEKQVKRIRTLKICFSEDEINLQLNHRSRTRGRLCSGDWAPLTNW